MGGARRLGTRAVGALLFGGLTIGVVTGFVVTPGAGASVSDSTTVATVAHSALASHAGHVPPNPATVTPAASPSAGVTTAPPTSDQVPSAPSLAVPVSLDVATPAAAPTVSAPSTEAQVATDLIAAIDAQANGGYAIVATPTNVSVLETWMNNEGGLWADNPLNTSLYAGRYPHQFTTGGSDTGIPIFPDIVTGIDATATTLLTNDAYAGILGVLAEGTASCVTFARAVIDSPWASSHYGGDPAHFCGASGGSLPAAPVTTACLRLPPRSQRGHPRSSRRPGACGHSAATAGTRAPGRPGPKHRRRAGPTTPPARHARVSVHRAASFRHGRRRS